MSFEVSGGNREWRQEPSTDPERRSFSSPNDLTQSPSSYSSSRSDRSKTGYSNRSLRDNSSSETSGGESETHKTPEKRKNKMCQTFPKVDKGFSWRKSPPWKRLSLKPQHAPFPTCKAENDVTQRVLSAQVCKIKELKDEMCHVQRTLEAVNRENRLLTHLQHRHMKALQKYESTEGGIHHLISRHNNEVRTLRENLRATQESERGLTLKLKIAESELLKAKDSIRRLQRLSEDKNLAEREELNNKLSNLLIKMEIDSTKVKVLEKQLHLTARFYDRQMSLESKKASEARDTARRLQDHILVLQQTIKEKERELHIKNIYAHRMPKNIWKCDSLDGQRGLTVTKSTQTESEVSPQDQPGGHEAEEHATPPDKNIESENESARKEDNDPQMTSEGPAMWGSLDKRPTKVENPLKHIDSTVLATAVKGGNISAGNTALQQAIQMLLLKAYPQNKTPTHDVLQTKDSDNFLEIDEKYKEQNKETTEGPNQLSLEEHLGLEDSRHYEQNQADDSSNENKIDSGKRVESSDTRSLLRRLSRRYTFTAATENLHQGLPATGPIHSLSKAHSCKSLQIQHNFSLGHEELSLPKIESGDSNEKKEKNSDVSLRDRKKNLMEELFGPGYNVKNSFSSDFVTSDQEFNF
ncbi:lebercilin-like protein [Bufo bufo]|uniref:lebercilin-like protein n=1 Tax=Bufo bufo TaxID=8384 RepID=UPI001ABE1C6E|nr:lebercilin-like protein [Bufo bufo]